MKQAEEMMQAVRDWVKSNMERLKKENDQSFLKKTGDASRVTTAFSGAGSRALPSSGEELAITIGKIQKYLTDLSGGMAFTRDYDQLSYKPLRSSFLISHEATSSEYLESVTGMDYNNALLVYGIGGASTATLSKKKADFVRAYLVVCDRFVDYSSLVQTGIGSSTQINENGHPITYTVHKIQLGTKGDTARWAFGTYVSSAFSDQKFCLTISIPKGSWANVEGMRIPLFTQYANNK